MKFIKIEFVKILITLLYVFEINILLMAYIFRNINKIL